MDEINEMARYCFALLADLGDQMDIWFDKNSDGLLFLLIVIDIIGVIAMWVLRNDDGNEDII
ncbi:MAG: hypothetical protein H7831_17995 [Magnetococcus sp. WYHC-3]